MIRRCIKALLEQTYPSRLYEILIVDNGSEDDTVSVIQDFPVTLLVEGRRSPYAARNLALRSARGEVIALTDADCVPRPEWIERGVAALYAVPADLVGGNVQFLFSPRKTAGEMYDSLANLEMKKSITLRGQAKTGNLFVRRTVFDRVGEFPDTVRSGGDKLWTGRATRAGFTMIFGSDVVVGKQARTFWPLMKKSYRIGRGHPAVWADNKQRILRTLKVLARDAFPPSSSKIREMIAERGTDDMLARIFSIRAVAWSVGLASTLGRLHGFAILPFRKRL